MARGSGKCQRTGERRRYGGLQVVSGEAHQADMADRLIVIVGLGGMRKHRQLAADEGGEQEEEAQATAERRHGCGVSSPVLASTLQNIVKAFSTYSRSKLRTMKTRRES